MCSDSLRLCSDKGLFVQGQKFQELVATKNTINLPKCSHCISMFLVTRNWTEVAIGSSRPKCQFWKSECIIFACKGGNWTANRRLILPRMRKNSPFRCQKSKKFLGRGHSPLPRPHPVWDTPSPTPLPSAPSAPRSSHLVRQTLLTQLKNTSRGPLH